MKNAIEHSGKAVAGSVISGLFSHGLKKEGIKEIMPLVNAILREVNSISLNEQEKEFQELESLIGHRYEREGLPELEGAEGAETVGDATDDTNASTDNEGATDTENKVDDTLNNTGDETPEN